MKQVKFRLDDDDYILLLENLNCSVPEYCKIIAEGVIEQLNNRNILPEEKQFVSVDLRDEYINNEIKSYFTDSQKKSVVICSR